MKAQRKPLDDKEVIERLRDIDKQLGGSYAIQRAIEVMEQGNAWVPVSERLPKNESLITVTKEYIGSWSPKYREVSRCYFSNGGFGVEKKLYRVIAWLPNPSPYQGEAGE